MKRNMSDALAGMMEGAVSAILKDNVPKIDEVEPKVEPKVEVIAKTDEVIEKKEIVEEKPKEEKVEKTIETKDEPKVVENVEPKKEEVKVEKSMSELIAEAVTLATKPLMDEIIKMQTDSAEFQEKNKAFGIQNRPHSGSKETEDIYDTSQIYHNAFKKRY